MKLVQKPPQAKSLAAFELDDLVVAKIVKDAHSERERVSTFAPSNARGLTFYNWIVTGVRKHLVQHGHGWKKKSVNGLEVVEHAEQRIRIAYAYVSSAGTTGDMTSSPRGPVSVAAAAANLQLKLWSAEWFARTSAKNATTKVAATSESEFETWFIAIEPRDDRYRVVLALPTETAGGRFVEWEHTLAIADVLLDSEPNADAIKPPPAETTAPPRATRKKKPGNNEPESSANTG